MGAGLARDKAGTAKPNHRYRERAPTHTRAHLTYRKSRRWRIIV